jgi:hypothetical protein
MRLLLPHLHVVLAVAHTFLYCLLLLLQLCRALAALVVVVAALVPAATPSCPCTQQPSSQAGLTTQPALLALSSWMGLPPPLLMVALWRVTCRRLLTPAVASTLHLTAPAP